MKGCSTRIAALAFVSVLMTTTMSYAAEQSPPSTAFNANPVTVPVPLPSFEDTRDESTTRAASFGIIAVLALMAIVIVVAGRRRTVPAEPGRE